MEHRIQHMVRAAAATRDLDVDALRLGIAAETVDEFNVGAYETVLSWIETAESELLQKAYWFLLSGLPYFTNGPPLSLVARTQAAIDDTRSPAAELEGLLDACLDVNPPPTDSTLLQALVEIATTVVSDRRTCAHRRLPSMAKGLLKYSRGVDLAKRRLADHSIVVDDSHLARLLSGAPERKHDLTAFGFSIQHLELLRICCALTATGGSGAGLMQLKEAGSFKGYGAIVHPISFRRCSFDVIWRKDGETLRTIDILGP